MLVQCTRPCGPRALDASKFSARPLDLSYSLEKVNAHLLTSNSYIVVQINELIGLNLNTRDFAFFVFERT